MSAQAKDLQMVQSAVARCRTYDAATLSENERVILLQAEEIGHLRAALSEEWAGLHAEMCGVEIDGCASYGGEKHCWHPRPAIAETENGKS